MIMLLCVVNHSDNLSLYKQQTSALYLTYRSNQEKYNQIFSPWSNIDPRDFIITAYRDVITCIPADKERRSNVDLMLCTLSQH